MKNRAAKFSSGRLTDQRKNHVLADAVNVGLIYWEVFGTGPALQYLATAGVSPRIVERVLTGYHRRWSLLA